MFLLKRKDSSKLTPYLLIHALSAATGVILLKLLHVCMELEVCVCSVEQIGARSWDCEDTEVETERTLGAEKKKKRYIRGEEFLPFLPAPFVIL